MNNPKNIVTSLRGIKASIVLDDRFSGRHF